MASKKWRYDMGAKIWIAAGGTGGHLFPALALAAQLQRRDPSTKLLFIGGGLESNRFFGGKPYRCLEVPCGSIVNKHPIALLKSGVNIARGVRMAYRHMRQERPDLLIGFGSYYALPPLMAAKLAGVPFFLHAADVIPGRVIRLMAPFAELTVLHFEQAVAYLRGRSTVAPMPLREGLRLGAVSKAEARCALGLQPDLTTLLVFGGSQGARRLNQLVSAALLKNNLPLQVIHYTGDAEVATELQQRYIKQGIRACVKAFEPRMELAWSAADVAILRAGASTVAEMREFEIPAILIPYPYGTDNHQEKNADVMVDQIGGAIKLIEATLTPEELERNLAGLLANSGEHLGQLRRALRQAKETASPQTIDEIVVKFLRGRGVR